MQILGHLVWFNFLWIVSSADILPNIILMLADDLGNYEVGFHNPRAITPHIDDLAHSGIILERHYTYHMCGPTRSATMTGRLPFHNNQHNVNDLNSTAGVDLRMTMLPAKLKQAGYATSMIGKSHLGARSVAHLPINRGFDQHFGFLGGGEDHYTQVSGEDPVVGNLVDLWRDHGPAYGENGTFSGYLYSREAERVITQHAARNAAANTSTPLFMYLAWHLVHSPLEAPSHYFDPKCADNQNRQLYHAMTTALDEAVGNVTRALRANHMYNNTLIVFYSDNGGPLVTTGKSSNNYPLKGGKTDDFEGGTRVAAFLSGGFVPPSLRGGVNRAYMHAADWYATLCGLAGVDPTDTTAGGAVPPIDSVDQWPTILTPNATMAQGARQEMVLHYDLGETQRTASGGDAALIQGEYKVVTGHQGASGFWTGPVHPNATGPPDPERNGTACGAFACCEGCLFNILDDPTEHHNLRESMPDKYAQMHARLTQLGNGTYQTSYIQPGLSCLTAQQAKIYYKGFRGPLCFAGSAPVVPTPPPKPHPGFQLVYTKAISATERKRPTAESSDMCLVGGDKLALAACPTAAQWRIGDARSGELQATRGEKLCIKLVESDGWNCANRHGSNATEVSMRHCALGPGGNGAHPSNYFHLVPTTEGDTDRTNTGRAVLIRSHDCPKLCVAPLAVATRDHGMGGGNHRVGLTQCTARGAVWTQRIMTGHD